MATKRTETVLSRVDVLTLFPGMFEGPLTQSLLGRAKQNGLIDLHIHNIRDFAVDRRHYKVDDRPFGGGAGMVLQAEPIYRALRYLQRLYGLKSKVKPHVVFLSPQGRVLTQQIALRLSRRPWVILVCGHYEGVDERLMRCMDEEISIGDYVLTGGEIPAMVLADVVLRLVPGVVKETASLEQESFQAGQLDYPQYTRPALWRGRRVPGVLLSGDHSRIGEWRVKQSALATLRKRPDLVSATTTQPRS